MGRYSDDGRRRVEHSCGWGINDIKQTETGVTTVDKGVRGGCLGDIGDENTAEDTMDPRSHVGTYMER